MKFFDEFERNTAAEGNKHSNREVNAGYVKHRVKDREKVRESESERKSK